MDVSKSPEVFEDDAPTATDVQPKPKTITVLGLLVVAAGTFSYLAAYAATDALAKVNVIRPLSRSPDHRPTWTAVCFVSILTMCLIAASVMRLISGKQFQQIDKMSAED